MMPARRAGRLTRSD